MTMNVMDIWSPRYHDNKVLLAKYKVHDGINKIVFTKARHLTGKSFYITGEEIRKHKLENNGRIPCYAVPFDLLKQEGEML